MPTASCRPAYPQRARFAAFKIDVEPLRASGVGLRLRVALAGVDLNVNYLNIFLYCGIELLWRRIFPHRTPIQHTVLLGFQFLGRRALCRPLRPSHYYLSHAVGGSI